MRKSRMSKALDFINSKIRVITRAPDDPRGQHSRDIYNGNYDINAASRALLPATRPVPETVHSYTAAGPDHTYFRQIVYSGDL